MPTKETLELAQTYGLGMFLSIAMLVGLGFLIRWDKQASDKRETRSDLREKAHTDIITVSLAAMSTQLQTVAQTLQTVQAQAQTAAASAAAAGESRYAIFMKAQEMQRIEHQQILERLGNVHENVKEIECRGNTDRRVV